jgi:hypothetical protein
MRADTHDGPEQIAPLQRPDTLMQLSRSLSWKSILYRTAGPYMRGTIGSTSCGMIRMGAVLDEVVGPDMIALRRAQPNARRGSWSPTEGCESD